MVANSNCCSDVEKIAKHSKSFSDEKICKVRFHGYKKSQITKLSRVKKIASCIAMSVIEKICPLMREGERGETAVKMGADEIDF